MMKKTLLLFIMLLFPLLIISQEIGINDFRISNAGVDGDDDVDADNASVAYNTATNQYLVVWDADDPNNEGEIFGQLINADTGAEIGSDFRISTTGPDGSTTSDASLADVAYNATNNEFLVVWHSDNTNFGLADNENEIFGQRISATGTELGSDFRISFIAGTGNIFGNATDASIAWNSTTNQYNVVWTAYDLNTGAGLEYEIYSQIVSNVGTLVGSNNRITNIGGFGTNSDFNAFTPDITYNVANNEYLVVFQADGVTDNRFEIFGQRLNSTGAEIGTNDFQISNQGPAGDDTYDASNPAVAYNMTSNEYLVVWSGEDNTAPLVEGEDEIFGQRLSNLGAEVGVDDFRISVMGDDTETVVTEREDFDAEQPSVLWDATSQLYMVVWHSDDNRQVLRKDEQEIFGAFITSAGGLVGSQVRLSDLGDNGNPSFGATRAGIALNNSGEALIVFDGDDNTGALAPNEREVFGQRYTISTANNAPQDIVASPAQIDDGTTSGTKVSDLLTFDPDLADTFSYTLVAGAGDTDNASFSITGSDLFGNVNFDFATQSVYNIRVQVNDGTTSFQRALVLEVLAPQNTIIGNNIRISFTGADNDDSLDTRDAAVEHNSVDDEFLVVWTGENVTSGKDEIFGQRVSPTTGALLGSRIDISDIVAGDVLYTSADPEIAYNSTTNQFLVIWTNDSNTDGQVDNENQIFGQLINGNGTLSGANFRISQSGGLGGLNIDAEDGDVTYNATNNEFLVVWEADPADGEDEVYGQRISAVGAEIGTNDFRISTIGADGDTALDAFDPTVVWNSVSNEYLVVYEADEVSAFSKTYGTRLSNTGAILGTADFEIISGANDTQDTDDANVTYNAMTNQYLVSSDINIDGKQLIYTQLVNANGTLSGAINNVSDLVPGNVDFDNQAASLAYFSQSNEYVAVFQAEDNQNGQVDNEFEIYAQRISATNVDTGDEDEKISNNGGVGDAQFDPDIPSVAYSPNSNVGLIVYQSDDNAGALVDNKFEIYGQLYQIPVPNTDPVAICQDITVQLDENGNVTITGDDIDNGSTDSDMDMLTFSVTPNTFDCDDIGTPQIVTLTVDDGNGGTDSCTATVTIKPFQFEFDGSWSPEVPGTSLMPPCADVVVTSGTATLPNDFSITNLTVNGGSLAVSAEIIIKGNIVNNAGFDATSGTLIFTDNAMHTVSGSSQMNVGDVTLNSPASSLLISSNFTDTGAVSDQRILNVFGTLTPNNGTIVTNDELVFKSVLTGTGIIGDTSNATITGTVVVERAGSANRSFRLLTAPVDSGTVKANWMEGANNPDTDTNINPSPGFGTHISGFGSAANGWDATTTNNPSLYTVDNLAMPAEYILPANSNESFAYGKGFLILVRGDRGIDLSMNDSESSTILRAKGNLLTGNLTLNSTLNTGDNLPNGDGDTGNGSSLVANPYQAPVDMESVLNSATDINQEVYHIYDPKIGDNGAFVTVTFANPPLNPNDANSFSFPLDEAGNMASDSEADRYLQPGQAAFINTNQGALDANGSLSPSVTFTQADKFLVETNDGIFLTEPDNTSPLALLSVALFQQEEFAQGDTPRDATLVRFSSSFDQDLDGSDAFKVLNIDENIATKVGDKLLSINGSDIPNNATVITLNVTNYRVDDYTLRISQMPIEGVTAYLEDVYLNTVTELSTSTQNFINFIIDANDDSSNADRFRIIYEEEILGAEDIATLSFGMYPNPNKGVFNIRLGEAFDGEVSVKMHNLIGQEVLNESHNVSGQQIIIETIGLQSGVYLVEVETATIKATKRLIIE